MSRTVRDDLVVNVLGILCGEHEAEVILARLSRQLDQVVLAN